MICRRLSISTQRLLPNGARWQGFWRCDTRLGHRHTRDYERLIKPTFDAPPNSRIWRPGNLSACISQSEFRSGRDVS